MFELREILVVAGMVLVFTVVMVCIGVLSFNKEARERGTTEKGYSVMSVIMGFIVAFTTTFALIFYELY